MNKSLKNVLWIAAGLSILLCRPTMASSGWWNAAMYRPASGGGGATPAYVQAAITNNVSNSRATTRVAVTNNLTAGNFLVVGFFHNSADTVSSVADTLGNTFTFATKTNFSGTGFWHYLYYATNITAGADVITATFSGANQFSSMTVIEFSGVKKFQPVDQMSAVEVPGTPSATITCPSKTTTQDGELIIGAFICNSGTLSTTAGYTSKNAGSDGAFLAYQVQSSQGSIGATCSDSNNADQAAGIMATFFHQ